MGLGLLATIYDIFFGSKESAKMTLIGIAILFFAFHMDFFWALAMPVLQMGILVFGIRYVFQKAFPKPKPSGGGEKKDDKGGGKH